MGQEGNVENINFDLANVSFNGVNIGFTKGGVDVNITMASFDALIDDYGDTPIKSYDRGTAIEIVINGAESARANLALAFPTAVDAGDRLKFGGQVGSVIPTGRLVIEPVAGNLDPIVVYKARATSDITISYINDDTVTIVTTFVGQIDTTRADGDQLFRIGGPAS